MDNVEKVCHPDHYQSVCGLEAIDVIAAFTDGLTGIEAFNTGNAIKYILRWKKKNGIEDLEKAVWYLNDLIDRLEGAQHASDIPNRQFKLASFETENSAWKKLSELIKEATCSGKLLVSDALIKSGAPKINDKWKGYSWDVHELNIGHVKPSNPLKTDTTWEIILPWPSEKTKNDI